MEGRWVTTRAAFGKGQPPARDLGYVSAMPLMRALIRPAGILVASGLLVVAVTSAASSESRKPSGQKKKSAVEREAEAFLESVSSLLQPVAAAAGTASTGSRRPTSRPSTRPSARADQGLRRPRERRSDHRGKRRVPQEREAARRPHGAAATQAPALGGGEPGDDPHRIVARSASRPEGAALRRPRRLPRSACSPNPEAAASEAHHGQRHRQTCCSGRVSRRAPARLERVEVRSAGRSSRASSSSWDCNQVAREMGYKSAAGAQGRRLRHVRRRDDGAARRRMRDDEAAVRRPALLGQEHAGDATSGPCPSSSTTGSATAGRSTRKARPRRGGQPRSAVQGRVGRKRIVKSAESFYVSAQPRLPPTF